MQRIPSPYSCLFITKWYIQLVLSYDIVEFLTSVLHDKVRNMRLTSAL